MKAIVCTEYGSSDVLHLKEVRKPTPRDDEVLIRIRAAVVTTADIAARSGVPFFARLAFGLRRPKKTILGTEFSGEIEAVGKDVERYREGDQVFAASGADFGAHAQYICLPEAGALATKPASMTFSDAAAVCEGALTALPFLRDKGKIQSGQRILINGASGSVGTSAVQFAKYFGADVTGICSTTNLELVKSLGADQVIEYSKEDFTQTNQTYDVILDAVGNSSFSRCKRLLTQGGIYLKTVPSLPLFLQVLWTSRFGSKKALTMFAGLRPPIEKTKDLVFIKELIDEGKLKPVIGNTYRFEQAAEAHRYVETGHKKGSAVLTFDGATAHS